MAWISAPSTTVGQNNDVQTSNDVLDNTITYPTNPSVTWQPHPQATDLGPAGGIVSYPIGG